MPLGDAFDHYAKLVEETLSSGEPSFEPQAESESAVQVERGLILPIALAGPADAGRIGEAVDRLLRPGFWKARVVDAAGHSRPAYPGLLVYAWRRGLALAEPHLLPKKQGDAWRLAQRMWCGRLHESILRTRDAAGRTGMVTPAPVAGTVDSAWAALAMFVCGHPSHASVVFPQVVRDQRNTGAFLPVGASDNPETYWYHELVLLHAVSAYAVHAHDAAAEAAAARAAEFHLNETQPDHATAEPWGLLAFIRTPKAHPLADQMLHTVRVQHPGGPRGVARILLADTLHCLRL